MYPHLTRQVNLNEDLLNIKYSVTAGDPNLQLSPVHYRLDAIFHSYGAYIQYIFNHSRSKTYSDANLR